MNPPIIFIHYGRSGYLKRTLTAALRSNPGKEIHFLGDSLNESLCPPGVRFHRISDHSRGAPLAEFREVFQPISGEKHRFNKAGGTDTWLRFVFERWFIIRNFLELHAIEQFWTFDSDTLISADLSCREAALAGFDATEQCRGCCLNGLVNSVGLVRAYTDSMTGLMKDADYLQTHRDRLKTHSGLAFNEMDAWQTFRDRTGCRTLALGTPRDGEVFDDALGIPNGFVPASSKVRNRIPLKMVLIDQRGAAWGLLAPSRAPVRFITLNLSWMPDYLYDRLMPVCRPLGRLDFDPARCKELSLSEPIHLRLRQRLGF